MSYIQMLRNAHPLTNVSVLLSEDCLNQLVMKGIAENSTKHYTLQDWSNTVSQPKDAPQGAALILVTDFQSLNTQPEFQKPENRNTLSRWGLIVVQNKQDKQPAWELPFLRINRVLRSDRIEDLMEDLHRALRKESALLIRHQLNLQAEAAFGRLSPRETEVLELMVRGYSIAEISDSLEIAGPTVKIHKSKVLEKTGCKNLRQLILVFGPRYLSDERLFK
ncbi:MAG: LuxR C-terminal-related transcriptional regulator [Limnobacter sp.]|nr:LuxR C-terminal-related transcriptional regulator [Limnobacter sp.]